MSGCAKSRSRRGPRRLAAALAAATTFALLFPGTARAFFVEASTTSGIVIQFTEDASFTNYGFLHDTLMDAFRAWEVQSLTTYVDFDYTSSNVARKVFAKNLDGPGDKLGQATTRCVSNASTCSMEFDTSEHWNTTTEVRDDTWIDFFAVAAHEVGHWHGLGHSAIGNAQCPSGGNAPEDIPVTDGQRPSMGACTDPGDTHQRTIAQDDGNGMHVARPYFKIMTANDSFEYTSPFYGWKHRPSAGGGSSTRYCNDPRPAYNGSCFVQFNGGGTGGASYYQDIFNRSPVQNGLSGKVRLRNRGPSSVEANVVLWGLTNGVSVSKVCSLPPNATSWTTCITPTLNAPGNVKLRLEVYNRGAYNMDVDTMIVQW